MPICEHDSRVNTKTVSSKHSVGVGSNPKEDSLNKLQRKVGNRRLSLIMASQTCMGGAKALGGIGEVVQLEEGEKHISPQSGEIINQAIKLFKSSETARTLPGRLAQWKLSEKNKENEIGYEQLQGAEGEYRPGIRGWGKVDIAVSDEYRRSVEKTARILVHEAAHIVYEGMFEKQIDEDMAAVQLELNFYQELLKGISVEGHIYKAEESFEAMSSSLRDRDYLVDDMIFNWPLDYLKVDVPWIRNHINDWGGLKKRKDLTKAVYLSVLCESVLSKKKAENTGLILDILDSIEDAATWHHIVGLVGGIEQQNYQDGLSMLYEALKFAGGIAPYMRRVEYLGMRWETHLLGIQNLEGKIQRVAVTDNFAIKNKQKTKHIAKSRFNFVSYQSRDNSIQRAVEGNSDGITISKEWAFQLTPTELETQIRILESRLTTLKPGTVEFDVANQNLHALQNAANFCVLTTPIVKEHPSLADRAEELASDPYITASYELAERRGRQNSDQFLNWFFSPNSTLSGIVSKPEPFMSWIDWWDDKKICRGARQAICDLAQERCNALPEDKATLESLKRGYSEWPPNLFAVFWGNDVFTCNVFVGDALFLDNKNQQNGGKYYSAEEIYDHQGRFTLINKEHVYRGDIAAWGDHVEIVTAVDRSNDTFCSRGGYADRSEETAGVGKEVCGGSKRRISVPTLRYLRVS